MTNASFNNMGKQFRDTLVQETQRRLFEESFVRLKKCLNLITEEEVWIRPNEETASIGNLILHLCGNARQWIVSTLGEQQDQRVRDEEFRETKQLPIAELLNLLELLQKDINKILTSLTPEALLQTYKVQCFEEKGVNILIHVVEHFSYHVGQISYAVKTSKGIDLGYYKGQALNQTS